MDPKENKENGKENGKGNGITNRNYKGKQNGRRQDKKGGTGKCQDPFWYAKTEEEIKAVASFPWNTIVGEKFFDNGSKDVIPGMVTLPYIPTMGSSINESEANNLTKAADAYYQAVSQGISGGYSEFEAPDLLFTALCGANLISKMIEAKRAYGISNEFADDNSYFARGILEGLGVDYDSFNGREYTRSDFRSDYNLRVDQINKIVAIPKGLTISDRWDYLNSWIFADTSAGSRSSLIAYVPAKHWIYDDTTFSTGTAIMQRTPRGTLLNNGLYLRTAQEIFADIDDMINALTGDDQRAMFGAIRKVYDDKSLKKLTYLEENFKTDIVRNDIISIAVHNAEFAYDVKFLTGEENNLINIYPVAIQLANGSISSVPAAGYFIPDDAADTYYEPKFPDQIILDSFDSRLTPGQTLDAIAHKMPMLELSIETPTEENGQTRYVWVKVAPRSEILLYPIITYNSGIMDDENPSPFRHIRTTMNIQTSSLDQPVLFEDDMMLMSHLNSAPLFQKWAYIGTRENTEPNLVTSVYELSGYIGEIDEYTLISPKTLRRSHNKAMYRMLQMPFGSKSVSR